VHCDTAARARFVLAIWKRERAKRLQAATGRTVFES
jgi:hypothetical protein